MVAGAKSALWVVGGLVWYRRRKLWLISRSISARVRVRRCGVSWHSHTVITLHPICRSFSLHSSSRRRLRAIFAVQYSLLDLGMCICVSCPCQKHPWDNAVFAHYYVRRAGKPPHILAETVAVRIKVASHG